MLTQKLVGAIKDEHLGQSGSEGTFSFVKSDKEGGRGTRRVQMWMNRVRTGIRLHSRGMERTTVNDAINNIRIV